MPLGQFLFEYLHRRGVRHSFGIPGDFALPTFTWLEKSKIRNITMTHEPAAGFAADAYSRINGIGLVCVTYCVGGLNVLNAIAGAYAEKSPVVVISGAPGRKDREKDPLLHHKVKTFETQRHIYDEVTVASTVLLDEQRAASEIVRCVEACLCHKRPVYIEIPHDIVDRKIPLKWTRVARSRKIGPAHSQSGTARNSLSDSRSQEAGDFSRSRTGSISHGPPGRANGRGNEHSDCGRSAEQKRGSRKSCSVSWRLRWRDEQRRTRSQIRGIF
jgi:TPP-dependent 2-oxoacid decarboxylase